MLAALKCIDAKRANNDRGVRDAYVLVYVGVTAQYVAANNNSYYCHNRPQYLLLTNN
jgi:hypothetical protein